MATPRDPARLAVSCSLLLLVAACGEDSTQPTPAPADVSGVYGVSLTINPASCEPADAFQVLEATMGDGTLSLTLRVEQLDGQVRITPLSGHGPYGPVTFEDPGPRVFPMEDDGSVRIENERGDELTLNGRTFFIRITSASTGGFDRNAEPISLSLGGNSTFVFREDGANAPVFATCTQTATMSGSRRGD